MQFRDLGERLEIIPENPMEETRLRRIMEDPLVFWTMDGGEEGNRSAIVIAEDAE